MRTETYTVRLWPERMNDEPGFSYEVRDGSRRLRAEGWCAGRRSHAAQIARDEVARLQANTNQEGKRAS
jgi:hypothetical protein